MKKCVFLQIAEDIRHKCELNLYGKGGKLPSCRELALQLGVNPNTVQRAYSELEKEGIIASSPKRGYFVAERSPLAKESAAREKIAELLRAGFTKAELTELIDSVIEQLKENKDD